MKTPPKIPSEFVGSDNSVSSLFFLGEHDIGAKMKAYLPHSHYLGGQSRPMMEVEQIVAWLRDNTQGPWAWFFNGSEWIIRFVREQDCVLYALRFPQGADTEQD